MKPSWYALKEILTNINKQEGVLPQVKNGITVGGCVFVDYLKQIDFYPGEGMLSIIRSHGMSVGGCVSNTAISLKRLDPALDLKAICCVGDDSAGEFVRDIYAKNGVDTSLFRTLEGVPTGYTDVYAATKGNTRSFFVNPGTNAIFDNNHIDFDRLDTQILHMGYILLLEKMDSPDAKFGTVMARTLHEAQKHGIKTSVDMVSEDSDRFKTIVPPSLKYSNYVIINEIEAGRTAGISPRDENGTLIWERLPAICEAFIDMGVQDYVVIHCPETGVMMDNKKRFTGMRSLSLPEGYIKGSVGSGDAFCAGTLLGIYEGLSPEDILRQANSAAAGCLSSEDGTGGVGSIENMKKLHELYAVPNEFWTV